VRSAHAAALGEVKATAAAEAAVYAAALAQLNEEVGARRTPYLRRGVPPGVPPGCTAGCTAGVYRRGVPPGCTAGVYRRTPYLPVAAREIERVAQAAGLREGLHAVEQKLAAYVKTSLAQSSSKCAPTLQFVPAPGRPPSKP
jgi:hypothetical protein